MIDDMIQLWRKRRNEKRCLHCGKPTPRATLCPICRVSLRYCPSCERVYPIEQAAMKDAAWGRASSYCKPCNNDIRVRNITAQRARSAECRAQISANTKAAWARSPAMREVRRTPEYRAKMSASIKAMWERRRSA